MNPTAFRVERPAAPLPRTITSEADLQRWRDEHADAKATLRSLIAERARILASASIDTITKKDTSIATERVRVERAAAVVEVAEKQAADQAAREAAREPERRRKYSEGQAAAAVAERIMRVEYEAAATALSDVLGRLAALRPAIDTANADLPADAEKLDPDAFRGRPAEPDRYEDHPYVVMVDRDGNQVHGHITTRNERDGEPWAHHEHGGAPALRQETRTRRVHVPGSAAVAAESLLTETAIPALRWNEPAYWPPAR